MKGISTGGGVRNAAPENAPAPGQWDTSIAAYDDGFAKGREYGAREVYQYLATEMAEESDSVNWLATILLNAGIDGSGIMYSGISANAADLSDEFSRRAHGEDD